jgi:outer membrane lipoprotein
MTKTVHIRNFCWILWANLLLLSACAKTIPSEAMNGVDDNISFESLFNDPEAFVGKTVVLGGDIILTENRPEKTHLIILQRDLDGDLKPLAADQSKGRFIVIVPEFLDPAIYTKGRRITIVGTITGKEIRQLSEIPHVYPVMEKKYLHLWPIENTPNSEPRVYFGIGIGIGSYGF